MFEGGDTSPWGHEKHLPEVGTRWQCPEHNVGSNTLLKSFACVFPQKPYLSGTVPTNPPAAVVWGFNYRRFASLNRRPPLSCLPGTAPTTVSHVGPFLAINFGFIPTSVVVASKRETESGVVEEYIDAYIM
jgi:hypothetical protein